MLHKKTKLGVMIILALSLTGCQTMEDAVVAYYDWVEEVDAELATPEAQARMRRMNSMYNRPQTKADGCQYGYIRDTWGRCRTVAEMEYESKGASSVNVTPSSTTTNTSGCDVSPPTDAERQAARAQGSSVVTIESCMRVKK